MSAVYSIVIGPNDRLFIWILILCKFNHRWGILNQWSTLQVKMRTIDSQNVALSFKQALSSWSNRKFSISKIVPFCCLHKTLAFAHSRVHLLSSFVCSLSLHVRVEYRNGRTFVPPWYTVPENWFLLTSCNAKTSWKTGKSLASEWPSEVLAQFSCFNKSLESLWLSTTQLFVA